MSPPELPWWAWSLCGIGSVLLARFAGRIADSRDSTPAEITRLVMGFAGIMCIVIGILALVS